MRVNKELYEKSLLTVSVAVNNRVDAQIDGKKKTFSKEEVNRIIGYCHGIIIAAIQLAETDDANTLSRTMQEKIGPISRINLTDLPNEAALWAVVLEVLSDFKANYRTYLSFTN